MLGERNGMYFVRSACKILMETLVETNMRSLDRNWMSIWKMNALPKVKLIFGAFAKISFLIGSGVKVLIANYMFPV